ncbi:ABC transporter ATP-binding protein [Rossellomorea marisflavi]|uniref:ABC transporter ATP-binding protein n=1 Tax=Rossellomorea marisflavi TaxID=189381 RepID=A0A0M0G603_9BACI|nr:ABC transporter ATP-binding protein [Rossellomorea marisflavi]KON84942.1 ABC transporter ATP-binding protein [Rossellomorea marisflavi]TYS54833.1 ABC transporter ATP-binding protein [Rossellomorea marisflavi]
MEITVSNVSKSFDDKNVINDISFTIPAGTICCLLGPSGSGKTTLIRLMIGAIGADQGSIRFGDVPMPDMNMLKKIGFMPQNDALYDDLSAEANLTFFGGLYHLGKKALEERIDEVLAIVDLTEHRRKLVKNFSGGMKKRLSLAASILHSPDLLFLDEPTVGIDPVLRRTIWEQFQRIKHAGTTIIVSTHVMDEVTECDRAALIYNGSLIEYDAVPTLLDKTENGRVDELFFMASGSVEGGAET